MGRGYIQDTTLKACRILVDQSNIPKDRNALCYVYSVSVKCKVNLFVQPVLRLVLSKVKTNLVLSISHTEGHLGSKKVY